jgi:hypothetical protein
MKDRAAGIAAVRAIQSWTKPGGFSLLTGYTTGQPLSADYSFLFRPQQLSSLYSGWKPIWYQESFRLTWGRVHTPKDVLRLMLGKRGFKAARIIAQKI